MYQNGVKEQFINKTGIVDNVYIKLNPIDSHNIEEMSREPITDIKRPEKFLLCAVGRLSYVKGYQRLLKIHKKLIDEGVEHELWIIGDGIDRKELQCYIINNQLQSSAKLLGFKENPYKYIKASDAFVCSSLVEGLSTVLIEATILDTPIVTTNCPGTKEILGENNECAIITKNTDTELYKGIKRMIQDKEQYEKFKKAIGQRKKMFELEKTIKDIETLIEQ